MKPMKGKFAKSVLSITLAIAGTSSTANALNKGQYFYGGLHTGASFINNSARAQYLSDDGNFLMREDSQQRGFNGGIFIGYNFLSCERYLLAAELSGIYYSNRGHYTKDSYDSFVGGNPNFETSYDLEYSLSVTLRPGFLINDTTLLYLQAGTSYGQLNTELVNLKNGNNGPFGNKFSDHEGEWGALLGVGIQKQISQCWSVFSAYQYVYYGRYHLKDGAEGGSLENPSLLITDRQQKLTENTFKFGLMYTF